MSTSTSGDPVELYMYDLSRGLATMLFSAYMGKRVEGIWHTGLVLRGKEYFFSAGIQQSPAGTTAHGAPQKKVLIGYTELPDELIEEHLLGLHEKFNAATYNLITNNCNDFSNDLALFLTGNGIPQEILDMPETVLKDVMSEEMRRSPLGPFIAPLVASLQKGLGQMHGTRDFGREAAVHSQAHAQETGAGHGTGMPGRDV